MWIEVPHGEVVDRITILELKAALLQGDAQVHAQTRCAHLVQQWESAHGALDELSELAALREVNRALWDVEDALRAHEARQDLSLIHI